MIRRKVSEPAGAEVARRFFETDVEALEAGVRPRGWCTGRDTTWPMTRLRDAERMLTSKSEQADGERDVGDHERAQEKGGGGRLPDHPSAHEHDRCQQAEQHGDRLAIAATFALVTTEARSSVLAAKS